MGVAYPQSPTVTVGLCKGHRVTSSLALSMAHIGVATLWETGVHLAIRPTGCLFALPFHLLVSFPHPTTENETNDWLGVYDQSMSLSCGGQSGLKLGPTSFSMSCTSFVMCTWGRRNTSRSSGTDGIIPVSRRYTRLVLTLKTL